MPDLPPDLEAALDNQPRYNPRNAVPFPRDECRSTPLAPSTAGAGGARKKHAEEMALLEEILGRKPAKGAELPAPRARAPPPAAAAAGAPVDEQLGAAVVQRLSKLEVAYRRLRDEAVGKDRELLRLRRDNSRLEQAVAAHEDSAAAAEQLLALSEENEQLRAQVHEMETFLNDYGLVWVGRRRPEPEPESAPAAKHQVDVRRLLQKLHELNELVGGEEPQIVRDTRGARFERQRGLRLAVYRNGMMLKAGPFRPWSSESARRFARDVLDGYFPSEFREEFPDGVLFEVVDCAARDYSEAFEGAGAGRALSRDEFLSRLPASVVSAGGQLVDVRAGVAGLLAGGGAAAASDGPRVVDTPAMRAAVNDEQRGDVATLQVRSSDGSQTLVLKMFFTDTVGDLRAAIDEQRPGMDAYELRTAFPNQAYTDNEATLSASGLCPNATLLMRPVSSGGGSSDGGPSAGRPAGLAALGGGDMVLPGGIASPAAKGGGGHD